jgi:3-phosphoshikimate 1-carboxyvinyltransferase
MSGLLIKGNLQKTALNISLPASKSICNRALILQKIAGNIVLHNLSSADDSIIMQQALLLTQGTVDVKNAGTCMRFLTAYYAATPGTDVVLHGSDRMHQRPLGTLVEALKTLGADIDYIDQPGFAPLRIKGKQLNGGVVEIDATVSSQFTSALMLAAPLFKNGLVIVHKHAAVSLPYIHMTASLMTQCGMDVTLKNDIVIKPFSANLQQAPVTVVVEPDWSAASYWYALVACGQKGIVTLNELTEKSIQGDAVIASVMRDFGVNTEFTSDGAVLTKGSRAVHDGYYDMGAFPDLVPSLAVVACALNISCTFTQVAHLEAKESKRLTALCTELAKCGFNIAHNGNELYVKAVTGRVIPPVKGFDTYSDHRMAMCVAPLALLFGEIKINDAEVVEKSYPHFWSDLQKAGFVLINSND